MSIRTEQKKDLADFVLISDPTTYSFRIVVALLRIAEAGYVLPAALPVAEDSLDTNEPI
jgi:hypothetical protein